MNGVSGLCGAGRPGSMIQIAGNEIIVTVTGTNADAFYDNYGKFVALSSNIARIATVSDGELFGWALIGKKTVATGETLSVNIALDAVYEIPIDATMTKATLLAILGDAGDIVQSTYQYLDSNGTTNDVVQVVGFNYYGSGSFQQTALVRLNPNELCQTETA